MQKHLLNNMQLVFCLAATLFCSLGVAQTALPSVQPEVYQPLTAAQEALKNNQSQQAVSLAKEALAVSKITPAEQVLAQRTLAVAALAAKDFDQAIVSLEMLVTQPGLTAEQQRPFLESLMNACQQKKDHAGVVKWSRQYLAGGGSNPSVRPVLIQTLSVMHAHADVITEMLNKIQLDANAGQKTPENELRILAVSYRQQKDMAGYEATLLRLLETYPTKAYWAEAISRQASRPDANPRFELDLMRLMEDTGNLEDSSDINLMAELALRAGLPFDAKRVLDQGFELGVLGKGSGAAVHQKLRQQVAAKTAEDDKLQAAYEKSAKDSNAWMSLGDVCLSKQQWSQAVRWYKQADSAGNIRRESELVLHHAIALLRWGKADESRQMLEKIKDDKTAMEVANLWRIRSLTLSTR
jgi:tetratricopeptide (TPR) repeat protein